MAATKISLRLILYFDKYVIYSNEKAAKIFSWDCLVENVTSSIITHHQIWVRQLKFCENSNKFDEFVDNIRYLNNIMITKINYYKWYKNLKICQEQR